MAILLAHRHTTLVALSAAVPKRKLVTEIQSGFKPTVGVSDKTEKHLAICTHLGNFIRAWITKQQEAEKVKNDENTLAMKHYQTKPKPTGSFYHPAKKTMPSFTPSHLDDNGEKFFNQVTTILSRSFFKWGTSNVPQHINSIIRCALYAAMNQQVYENHLTNDKIWPLYYEITQIIQPNSASWQPWIEIDIETHQEDLANKNSGPMKEQISESYRATGSMEINVNLTKGINQIWQQMMKLTAIRVPVKGKQDEFSEPQMPSSFYRSSVDFVRVSHI